MHGLDPELEAWLRQAAVARGVTVPEIVALLLFEAQELAEVRGARARGELHFVRRQIEAYAGGDRAPSPPVALLREERRLAAEVAAPPTGCPRCGTPPGVECDEGCASSTGALSRRRSAGESAIQGLCFHPGHERKGG